MKETPKAVRASNSNWFNAFFVGKAVSRSRYFKLGLYLDTHEEMQAEVLKTTYFFKYLPHKAL